MIGALAPAIPEAAVGAANGANTTAVFFGHDPRYGRDYVYLETLGGGFGGRFTKDGKDGVQVHITNTSNLPVELIEMEYPLLVESYGFVPDSGGAGKHRGGLGLRRVVRPVGHTMTFSGQGERFVNRPWGVFGGHSGGTGRFVKLAGSAEVLLPTKPANLQINEDEAVVMETPGSGGYGKPEERDAAAIENDFKSGKFSRELHQGALRRGAEGMSYDAIVVGAGISGAATAYHLRKAGAKTLLIERGEPASGGTGKSAAIIRQSYSTPLLVRLARASITMFENAKAELGRDAGFVQSGYCFVLSNEMLEGAKKNVAMQRGLGIVNEWSEGAGFPEHLPEINPEGIAGIVYEPHGGYADPVQATEAYVEAFKALGGEFRARTPARGLLRKGDRVTGVELDSGEIPANIVVNAAGPWAKPLAESAGLDLPMRSVREQDTVWQVPAGRAVPKTSVSMGVDATYYRPLGQSLHHRARLSEGVRRRRSLQLQDRRGRRVHRRRANARRAPLPGLRRHEADRGLCGAL